MTNQNMESEASSDTLLASPRTAQRDIDRSPHRPQVERVDRRCTATTKAGTPCPVRPMAGRDRCRHHEAQADPKLAEQVALERRLGGYRSTMKQVGRDFAHPDLRSRDGVATLLEDTVDAVRKGELAPSVANSVAQLANVALRLAELELDARITALEAELAQDTNKRPGFVIEEDSSAS